MINRAFSLLAAAVLFGPWASWAASPTDVKVMTQNMDAGTDLTYIVAAATNSIPGFTVADAVDLTFAEVQAGQLEQRAGLLAKQIAHQGPDIVAIQEATLWRAQVGETTITFDQLAFLLAALEKLGAHDIVAVNTVNDVALPGSVLCSLRFTDRDVLLVRSGVRPPGLHFSDVHSRIFGTACSVGGLRAPAGWILASVHTGNKHFRLATTHLEPAIPGACEAADVQVPQTQELLHDLRNSTVPVVILGDFNSDANDNHNPKAIDVTPSADLIQAAGYTDTWRLFHGSSEPGNTWPLYLEDSFTGGSFFTPAIPFERIDLIFSQGLQVLDVQRVFAPGPSVLTPGSDHAGVIATLSF